MNATETHYGVLRADGDRCAVRFERAYDATPEELWAALTERDRLRRWLAEAASFELEPGGTVDLRFGDSEDERVHGRIRELDPPRLLEYTWQYGAEDETIVRFELVPQQSGVLLVLDHGRLARDVGAGYGAGWHAHLDQLAATLHAEEESWDERFRALLPAYESRARALGWVPGEGSPLVEALAAGDHERARVLARERPELRSERDADGLRPAMRALYVSGRDLAEDLAPANDELDLFEAAGLGRVDRVRELLDAGSDAASLSPDGFTALHLACFAGGAEVVRLLGERGAPLEMVSQHEQVRVRPLGTAAFAGDHAAAEALLALGADPDGAGEGGFGPLHAAAQNGDAEMVRLLLAAGATATSPTDEGRTPAELADAEGHAEVVGLLSAAGAAAASCVPRRQRRGFERRTARGAGE